MSRIISTLAIAGLVIGTAACGSDAPTQAATATKGDAFCAASAAVDVAGKAINFDTGTPAELETTINAAITAAKAAQKVAPKDAVDMVAKAIDLQEQLRDVLAKSNFDVQAAATTDEFIALTSSEDFAAIGTELDTYNQDKCGIAPD